MKKLYFIMIGAVLCSSIIACKDEVIIPVEDKTLADSLVGSINEQSDLIIEASTELNQIRITNQKLEKTVDSLYDAGSDGRTKVLYTVNVLSIANAALVNARTSGISGATVTFSQNGTTQTQTTDLGLATFEATNGAATVYISAQDYGQVEYIVQIHPGTFSGTVNTTSQIFLFPKTAAKGAATISGKVWGNLSTLNDTLGRVYGGGAPAALQGKYITSPGPWSNFTNYTQNSSYKEAKNIYGEWTGSMIGFEKVPVSVKIFATPNVPTWAWNDNSDDSYISTITYKGIISSSNVDANGNYSLDVFARAEDGTSVKLSCEKYIWAHERLTTSEGANTEPGFVEKTFKNYNLGTGVATDDVRKTVSTNYQYEAFFPIGGSNSSPTFTVRSNQQITRNVYFFPLSLIP